MDSTKPLNPPTSAVVPGDPIPPSDRSTVEPRETQNPESHHQTLAGPAHDVVEIGWPAGVAQYASTTPATRFPVDGRVLVGPCSGNAPPRSRGASPSAANSPWANSPPYPRPISAPLASEHSSDDDGDAPPFTLPPAVRGSKVRPQELRHFYTSDSEEEQDASDMQRGRPLNRKARQTPRAAPLPYTASGYNPGPSHSHGLDVSTKRAQNGVAGARKHDFGSLGAVETPPHAHRSKRAKHEGPAEDGTSDVEGQLCGQGTGPPPNSPWIGQCRTFPSKSFQRDRSRVV